MESPAYLRLSLAAAMELGFTQGFFHRGARLHCINLLLTYDDGCRANCAFCGLSRDSQRRDLDKKFIRVSWKAYPVDEILERIAAAESGGVVERVCLSMITHPRAKADTLGLVERIVGRVGVPLSLLIAPTIMDRGDLAALKAAGADRVGVAIDCVTPELFDRLRGKGVKGPHVFENYWRVLGQAVEVFGAGMAGVHLICGLGETEREFCQAMQRARDLGGFTHLFSFFPEKLSAINGWAQPEMSVYRRVQLARWLIDHDLARESGFVYDPRGRVTDFGVGEGVIEGILAAGDCFRTSGCPGRTMISACNRPFANERPGQPIRNFPFALEEEDKRDCREQLWSDMRPAEAHA